MKHIFFFIAILFSCTATASDIKYNLIINTTDTITQLHLFQIENTIALPKITDIYTTSSGFNLTQTNDALKPLLDNATKKLYDLKINPSDVPVNILGTEYMRSLPIDTQNKIYSIATHYIQTNYTFPVQSAISITGKMEGVYNWLDANYLNNSFEKSDGTLNIGTTSTSIAYAIPASQNPDDEVNLTLLNHHYILFSKNFSNLGEDTSRFEINKDDLAYTCYPIDFPIAHNKGNFHQEQCKDIYTNFVEEFQLRNHITPIVHPHFVVFGDANKIYQFLDAEDPDVKSYEARLYYTCTTVWEMMKREYDNITESELAVMCANAVFIDRVIYQGFNLTGNQLWVTDKINGKIIDWPLGFILYHLLEPKGEKPY